MFRTLLLAPIVAFAVAACGPDKPHELSIEEKVAADAVKPYCGPVISSNRDQLCNAFVIYKNDDVIGLMTGYTPGYGYANITGRSYSTGTVHSGTTTLLYEQADIERFVGPGDPDYGAINQRYLTQRPGAKKTP